MYQQESAPAATSVKVLTWMTVVILVVMISIMFLTGSITVGVPIPISGIFWGMGFFFLIGAIVLLWLCWAQKPRMIRVEAGKLIVERKVPWANIELELGQVNLVQVLERLPRLTWRLFGNGGLFCFSGTFYHRDLGRFRASLTALKNIVLIATPQKTLVISPARPQELVDYIKSLYSVVPR